MTDIVDRLRAFTIHPEAEQSPKFLLSLDEAKSLLQDYDHLRGLAGAVSSGDSFGEIKTHQMKYLGPEVSFVRAKEDG